MKKNKRPDVPYKEYLLSLLAVAIISGGGMYSLTKERDQGLKDFQAAYPNFTDLEKVNETYQTIQENYFDKVDQKSLVDGAIVGMTKALDDPYSDYFVGETASDLNDTISGSFEGIGAILMIKDEQVTIAEPPIKESPAEKSQLQVGDIITKVDKKEVADLPLSEVVKLIKGKAGTTVNLAILREGKTFSVPVTREKLAANTVSGKLSKEDETIGIVTISSFSEHTNKEVMTTVKDLRKEGAKSWIIDLRQNPGGLLDQAAKISSMFLKDKEVIVKFEDKHKKQQQLRASKELDQGFKVTEPVRVLIDSNSASASEIVAAALNESADIPLIGEQSFGKGTVQTVQPLASDSDLKLTTSKWLTPTGKWIHKKGLKPTIAVDQSALKELTLIDTDQSYQLGMTGKSVKNINRILALLGHSVSKDSSDYTNETEAAVKALQEKLKLDVTGIIDEKTAQGIMTALAESIAEKDESLSVATKDLQKK